METSIMRKEGMTLFVEEVMLENAIKEEALPVEKKYFEKMSNLDASDKCQLIDLRNDWRLRGLDKPDEFVQSIMGNIGRLVLIKKAEFTKAVMLVYKINLILGTQYALKDVFVGADVNDKFVTYRYIDKDIMDAFSSKLQNYVQSCHDCLFGDICSKEALMQYIPTLVVVNCI